MEPARDQAIRARRDTGEAGSGPARVGTRPGDEGDGHLPDRRWKEALELLDQGEVILSERCIGVTWELATLRSYALWSLGHMGEIAELSRRSSVLVKEARARGDLYAEMNMGTDLMAFILLAADDPKGAENGLRQIMESSLQRGFHIQHHNILMGQVCIALSAAPPPRPGHCSRSSGRLISAHSS